MFGLIKRYGRALALGSLFLVASFLLASVAQPGRAAAAGGTIHGGVYYFDVNINGKAYQVPIDDSNTTATLSPTAANTTTKISHGTIDIANVAPNTYTLTLNMKLTAGACTNAGLKIFIPVYDAYCLLKDKMTYQGSQSFGGITVTNGNNTNVEADTTTSRSIGTAIQVDANGNPILQCKGDLITTWVVCPIITSIFGAMNFALTNFIQPYLTVSPLQATDNVTGKDTALYTIWNNIRNFTNILLILVFFVIILSQVTSFGVSNYGVKKLLPRLIAFAILANLSFYFCALLVDITNILGAGIAGFITNIVINGKAVFDATGNNLVDTTAVVSLMAVLSTAIITLPIAIPAVFIFLIIGAIIVAIAVICIILRQVLLIFLIVISPLALLAGVLPNTSSYATQWFNGFARLLLMYPLIMLLFALSKIAGVVLSNVGGLGG